MKDQIEGIRALMWAEIHMKEAIAASDHLAAMNPQTTPLHLSHCILAGIVVSYCRSFKKSYGLAPLDRTFSTFESEDHQKMHKYLMTARDQTYAHMDLTRERNEFTTPVSDENLQAISIEISSSGQCHWYVKREGTPTHLVPRIKDLCAFQLARIRVEGVRRLNELVKGKICTPGVFTLGVDWPPEP